MQEEFKENTNNKRVKPHMQMIESSFFLKKYISLPVTYNNSKSPITEPAQPTPMTDLIDWNFTPLQIMIGSDMMTDVCSC